MQLNGDETTGGDDFTYREHPDVVGVVVNKGSHHRYQAMWRRENTVKVYTGRGRTDVFNGTFFLRSFDQRQQPFTLVWRQLLLFCL